MSRTPTALAEVIALHKAMFGGYQMMADEPGDPAPDPAPDPQSPPDPDPAADKDEPLGEPGKRALTAEREARQKAEQDLASKSAEEKAAEALAEAQKTAAENAAKALRYEVAAAKGIDLKLASRLTGANKAELEADADALKALLVPPNPQLPDPTQGQGKSPRPATLADAISAHYGG